MLDPAHLPHLLLAGQEPPPRSVHPLGSELRLLPKPVVGGSPFILNIFRYNIYILYMYIKFMIFKICTMNIYHMNKQFYNKKKLIKYHLENESFGSQ